MSMTDPIADLLTQINNGQRAGKAVISVPASKLKYAVCLVFKDEGYIQDVHEVIASGKKRLTITLKYYLGQPVIESLTRVSKPSRRVYKSVTEIPSVLGGLGVAIVSTSHGVMSDRNARMKGHGGEILCIIS